MENKSMKHIKKHDVTNNALQHKSLKHSVKNQIVCICGEYTLEKECHIRFPGELCSKHLYFCMLMT